MFDSDAIAEKLLTETFELESLLVELQQLSENPAEKAIGAGQIRQEPDGQLRCTVYCPGTHGLPFRRGAPVGKLIPREDYVRMRFQATDGKLWVCEQLLLGQRMSSSGSVLDFHVPSLSLEEALPEAIPGSSFRGHAFGTYKIASNAPSFTGVQRGKEFLESSIHNLAQFAISDGDVQLRREEAQLVCHLSSGTGELAPKVGTLLVEALQFVLGATVRWNVSVRRVGSTRHWTVLGQPRSQNISRLQPPVPVGWVESPSEMWRLFGDYYALVAQNRFPEAHKLSEWWWEVIQASGASLSTQLLISSVVIEGVAEELDGAGVIPADNSLLSKRVIKLWRDAVSKVLEHPDCPVRLRNRVLGLFGAMRKRSAKDRLYALAEAGAIDEELVAVWERVRHAKAHGALGPFETSEFAEELRAADALVTLLYQMYFHRIGYRGHYSYFAKDGWPAQGYPPGR